MENRLPPSVGVIGGMGPWVDPLMLRKILEHQAGLGMREDREAIPLLLAQVSPLIEDRTRYLERLASGEPGENPAENVARIGRGLAEAGAVVLGIPCNTFHAGPIFERFKQELSEWTAGGRLRIVHMIEATIEDIVARFPWVRRAGVLSTNGTYRHRIFAERLEERGLGTVTLPYSLEPFSAEEQEARKEAILEGGMAPMQNDVHHAIYHAGWGIKSGQEARGGYPTARGILKAAVEELRRLEAGAVILGCTELPLALAQEDVPETPLCDPLDSLARGLVEAYRTVAGQGHGAQARMP